jgi:mannose-6-phosphate isomerase
LPVPPAPAPSLEPILLEPILLEKVWGGRRLESLGKKLPSPAAKYGESWEVADMASTSPSGAGGASIRSVIRGDSALRGRTLHEAVALWGEKLVGSPPHIPLTADSPFPLLVKFLDAFENLSVQVHPSPAYASSHPGANLKTECWYIADAVPGSLIYKGIKPAVTREEFSRLARAGDPRIVETLIAFPAISGECHNLPSGVVHALGAGVLVAEVQTPSDTTYRLFDWDRKGREMHIEQALECMTFPGEPGYEKLLAGQTVAKLAPDQRSTRLVTTEFFIVDEFRPEVGDIVSVGTGGPRQDAECVVLIMLAGNGQLMITDSEHEICPLILHKGDTAIIPAAIEPSALLVAGNGVRALRVGLA